MRPFPIYVGVPSMSALNMHVGIQGLSQDLGTGCPKMAIVKILGVQIFKGDHNILIFQP